MKRNTMRLLSLMLTLVMLLGAIPFVSATEATPELTATASKTEIWSGEEVTLDLDVSTIAEPWFVVPGSVEWNNDAGKGETVTVNPTATTTYTATYKLAKSDDLTPVTGTASVTVTVKQSSQVKVTISAASTAAVNEAINITVNGAGTSDLEWHVNKSGASVVDGVFTATQTGTYEVYVVALNDDGEKDNVTSNTITINVVQEKAAYSVNMSDKTFSLNATNPAMTYSVIDNATGKAYTGSKTVKFESSNTNVVKIKSITAGTLTLNKTGNSTITVTVTIGGVEYKDTAIVTVGNSGKMQMEDDGEAFDDDEVELEFTVNGPEKRDDVEWFFEVKALNVPSKNDSKTSPWFKWTDSKESDKRELEVEEEGDTVEVELQAVKGYGVAMISVTASWGKSDDEEAEGTFYVSFYDEVDYIFELKDDVDEFDFDEKGIFKSVTKNKTKLTGTQLTSANIAELLLDESADYIDLDEGSKAKKNEDVGEITTNSSKVEDYDPDDVNTYEIDELDYLTFEVDDEGTYQIEYVQYADVDGDHLVTGEGLLKIVVGEGTGASISGDVEYEVKNKGDINLDEDDFEDFWDDYCDDEDLRGDDAEFGYVMFEDYKSTALTGTLSAEDGDKSMNKSYKFHFEYDDDEDDGNKDFDLNEVLYEASSTKTNYVDEIDFVCYSENGEEEVEGTLVFIVGDVDEKEEEQQTPVTGTMNFTDVRSSDWYYNAVAYVYSNRIMAGTSDTKFEPNAKLTRGMVVTMLWRMEGEPSVTTNSFADVKDTTAWYYQAVSWAAKNGIVNGVTATTFAPNTNITREQLAAILYRYADYKGKDTAATKALTGYPDASSVSAYATTAMRWAVTKGIISGDASGRLNPGGNATRAEAATMFQRFMAQ